MRAIRSDRPDTSFEQILLECQPNSRATLVELACIDLIDRIRSGTAVRVEQYLKDAPELRDDTEELLDLIDAEICTRRERGDVPNANEYVRRFPKLATQVGRLFVLDNIESQMESDAIPKRDKTPDVPGFRLTRRFISDSISITYRAHDHKRRTCLVRLFEPGSRNDRQLNDALRMAVPPSATVASAATKTWHPNILAIHTRNAVDDRLFCVTEFADGLPLTRLITDGLTASKTAAWLYAVVNAMAFARIEQHSLGQVGATHILIDHKDQPRIIGSGLPLDESDPATSATLDIVNVGSLMFQMLTGRIFESSSPTHSGSQPPTADQTPHDCEDDQNQPTQIIDPTLAHMCLRCLGIIQPGYDSLNSISDELSVFISGRHRPVPQKSAIQLAQLLR